MKKVESIYNSLSDEMTDKFFDLKDLLLSCNIGCEELDINVLLNDISDLKNITFEIENGLYNALEALLAARINSTNTSLDSDIVVETDSPLETNSVPSLSKDTEMTSNNVTLISKKLSKSEFQLINDIYFDDFLISSYSNIDINIKNHKNGFKAQLKNLKRKEDRSKKRGGYFRR